MTNTPNSHYSLNVSRTAIRAVLGSLAALLVLLIGIAIGILVSAGSTSDALSSQVDSSRFQAVFLASNEVYFGKLSVPSGDFATMTNVYRLTSQATNSRKQPLRRTLLRLTTDVHGPADKLIINKRQILYVENLNPTGTGAKLLQQSGAAP